MKNLFLKISARKQLIFFIFLIVVASISSTSPYTEEKSILKYTARNPRVSYITHTITVLNTGKFPVRDVKVWVPIFRNETPHQLVLIKNLTANELYKRIETDYSNNTYVFWHINYLSSEKPFRIQIEYSVLSFEVEYTVNSSLVREYYKKSQLYEAYTKPEEYIESDDPHIVETARNIAGNETNPHVLALRIAEFVSENLTYELQEEERGARWALDNGRGDCSEFSYLFTALCRARGIPARVKVGFAFQKNNEETNAGHMWAEYYLPNYGWIPVDLVWHQVGREDALHFSSLQSFPVKYPYGNFFVEYSLSPTSAVKVYQTVKIREGSLEDFENFTLALLAYNATEKIKDAELLYFLSTLLGAKIFAPTEFSRLEEALKNFDLSVQTSLETGDVERMQQAYIQAERILGLVQGITFKCGIAATLLILVIILLALSLISSKPKPSEF